MGVEVLLMVGGAALAGLSVALLKSAVGELDREKLRRQRLADSKRAENLILYLTDKGDWTSARRSLMQARQVARYAHDRRTIEVIDMADDKNVLLEARQADEAYRLARSIKARK